MIDFVSLLPSKQLLQIADIPTSEGYTKRNTLNHSIIYSPLTILGFQKLYNKNKDFNTVIKHMHDVFSQSKYVFGEDVIFDVWLKMYGFDDEASFLYFMHQENPELIIGANFSDLASYMFLTGRSKFTSMNMEEWIIASEHIDIHKKQTPFNNLQDKDVFSNALNIMSSNYSISEVLNIMFMAYESQYDLFLKQNIDVSEFLNSKIINSTIYQMLIIYYYTVSKEMRKADPNSSLRLKEFLDYETRQEFYSFIYGFSFTGNQNFYSSLENMNVLDLYEALDDNIINRVHLLVNSEIPIKQWKEYSDVPLFWLKSLIEERTK